MRQGALTAEQVVTESRRYGNHLGVEFGTVYQSSAVIADGTQPPDVADSYSDYVPSATPGARAPHVWLGHPERAAVDARPVRQRVHLARRTRRRRLVQRCRARSNASSASRSIATASGGPGSADLGGFTEAYGLGEDGAVLVRPDGHVAWRSATGPAIGAVLRDAVERILHRERE